MIIGLTGPQRSGKDEVCSVVVREIGAKYLSIADEIKLACREFFLDQFKDDDKDKKVPWLANHTPRDLMIHVGQLDEFNGSLWVDRMMKRKYQGPDVLHVISSVGKPVQWKAIQKFCLNQRDRCALVRVSRPGTSFADNRRDVEDYRLTPLIKNEGTLDDLQRKTLKVFKEMLEEAHLWDRSSLEVTNY